MDKNDNLQLRGIKNIQISPITVPKKELVIGKKSANYDIDQMKKINDKYKVELTKYFDIETANGGQITLAKVWNFLQNEFNVKVSK